MNVGVGWWGISYQLEMIFRILLYLCLIVIFNL